MCIVQLIARITKHGWLDGDKKVFVFRDILDEVGKFLRVSKMSQEAKKLVEAVGGREGG